jgi:hypothetical protein
MTNIMVNKIQHNAILVMTYQNIQCFLRTLGCVSRQCIYTPGIPAALRTLRYV